jgi:hypothetical protein
VCVLLYYSSSPKSLQPDSADFRSSQVYPLISNQALNLVSYSPEIVACGSQFSANSSSSFSCDASTASKGSARPRGSLAGMAVVVFAGLVALLV